MKNISLSDYEETKIMKKTIAILFGLLIGALTFAQTGIKFETNNNITEVVNVKENGRIQCRDYVQFVNNTENSLYFKVYGKKTSDSEREFICMLAVKGNDTYIKKSDKKLKKYNYIEIECTNGTIQIEEITCEHNDMILYISDFKPNPKGSVKATNDR